MLGFSVCMYFFRCDVIFDVHNLESLEKCILFLYILFLEGSPEQRRRRHRRRRHGAAFGGGEGH